MSDEFRLQIPKRLTQGPPELVAEWNRMVTALERLERGVKARTLRPSATTRIATGPTGQRVNVLPGTGGGGSGVSLCALGLLRDASDLDGASEGDVYLSAGFVNAAGDSYPVGGPEGTILTPTIGDTVYAECDVEVEVDDGVLTGGWSSSAADIGQASSMPTDDTLDDSNTTGTIYAPLGEWIDDGDSNPQWQGASCGNVTFILCVQSNNTATANYYRG